MNKYLGKLKYSIRHSISWKSCISIAIMIVYSVAQLHYGLWKHEKDTEKTDKEGL